MGDLAAVNAVLQHQIESATGYLLATIRGAVGPNPSFAPDSRTCKFILQIANRFEHAIAAVGITDSSGLGFFGGEVSLFHVGSVRGAAAPPQLLLFCRALLFARTLVNSLQS